MTINTSNQNTSKPLPTPQPKKDTSPLGILLAVVMGALSTFLLMTTWAVLATVMAGLDTAVPVLPSLAIGAVIGLLLGIFRQGKTSSLVLSLVIGLIAGTGYLAMTAMQPIGLGAQRPFWGTAMSLITLMTSSFLTRYSLRNIRLSELRRDVFETLLMRVIRGFGFTFFLSIVIFPFYFMLISSFKGRSEILKNPTDLSLDFTKTLAQQFIGYTEVLFTFDFLRYIQNSTMVALATVVITLVLAVLGAYAVTRLSFPGQKFLSRSILLIYMFPAIVLVIPLYVVFNQLGLRDTLPGLLVVYPATTIPVALYMLRSYFQTLPKDLEEAGMIDGSSRFGVIWRITLPLSLPALASVGLYVFMIAWNEFLFAFMFLDSPEIFTLSRGMVTLNTQEVPRQFLMAGAVIVTVPIMAIFFFFEKYLVGGLTAGGVKG